MLRHRVGHVICGRQHDPVEALFHGEFIPLVDTAQFGIRGAHTEYGIMRKGHGIIQRTVIKGQQSCHNFRDTGRI